MKVFDCFTFFNELDLLEFRLQLLDKDVDYFVIAESNITHSGKHKPWNFEQNQERYARWKDKIIYIQSEQTAEGLSFNENEKNYNPENGSWKLENGQRNALARARDKISDEDLVIISDLDEMPDFRKLKNINPANGPHALSLLFHYYFLNCQNIGVERWWNGCIICNGKAFRETPPQTFRDKRNDYPRIAKAGWHFSFLGGLDMIRYKLASFAHTEFAKEEFMNDANILQAMEKGEDIFKRPGVKYKFYPLQYYPPHLRKLMQHYPHLLHNSNAGSFFSKACYRVKEILAG